MYDEDPQDDDEKALAEALALSVLPQGGEESKPEAEKAKEEVQQEPQVNIDANFMKDVIGDLGIDMDEAQLDDIVNEAKNANKDEEKDKKDGDKK